MKKETEEERCGQWVSSCVTVAAKLIDYRYRTHETEDPLLFL